MGGLDRTGECGGGARPQPPRNWGFDGRLGEHMSRFLLAWELGGGLGHLVPLSQVAQGLVARGHELHFVLRDLSGAAAALGALSRSPQVHLWQAPVWMPALQGLPPPVSYPELLFRAGYLDATRLGALVQAWRSVIGAIGPALLLADHAPTALLAVRGWPLKRATLGTGFFLPPEVQPMPAFREWEPVDPARLQASEARALAVCNAVLAQSGQPPLGALHELVAADERFLLTWPELDHYSPGPQGRAGGRYWGALAPRAEGSTAVWPAGDGPALLAYLKADYAALEPVLQQLAQAPCRTLAYVPGLSAAQRRRHAGPRLLFADAAVSMGSALAQARAVLCNAGSGTVCTALQAGVPVLMLPMHAEQLLFARRVVRAGAGGVLMEADAGPKLLPTLQRVLDDPALRQRAQALAALHAPERYGDVAQRVAERCEALACEAVAG